MNENNKFDYYKILFSGCRFKVKSFNLKPLTLGNLILFELLGINSLKYQPNDAITRDDIVKFLIITSRSYSDSIKLLSNGWWNNLKYKSLYRKYNNLLEKDIIKCKVDAEEYFIEFMDEIKKYYEYYLEMVPQPVDKIENGKIEENTKLKATPLPIILFYKMRKLLGINLNDCYNCPFNAALTWSLVDLELEGLLELNTMDNPEFDDFWKDVAEAEKDPEAFKRQCLKGNK